MTIIEILRKCSLCTLETVQSVHWHVCVYPSLRAGGVLTVQSWGPHSEGWSGIVGSSITRVLSPRLPEWDCPHIWQQHTLSLSLLLYSPVSCLLSLSTILFLSFSYLSLHVGSFVPFYRPCSLKLIISFLLCFFVCPFYFVQQSSVLNLLLGYGILPLSASFPYLKYQTIFFNVFFALCRLLYPPPPTTPEHVGHTKSSPTAIWD
jgi:hypothetical protein